jgi:hypothetical protein
MILYKISRFDMFISWAQTHVPYLIRGRLCIEGSIQLLAFKFLVFMAAINVDLLPSSSCCSYRTILIKIHTVGHNIWYRKSSKKQFFIPISNLGFIALLLCSTIMESKCCRWMLVLHWIAVAPCTKSDLDYFHPAAWLREPGAYNPVWMEWSSEICVKHLTWSESRVWNRVVYSLFLRGWRR